ncbi:DUF1617 family protein [uncultured Vagococcus sp.]|uniref:DUF1617 family protein n=1 Tax=uncultured Vagococcus sp. TaxID=189676 RepID=UPI00258DEA5F|nr:DUF1617 family protein [uncultured Vagococcus sp.]
MLLNLKNKQLVSIINFLNKLELKTKESRSRSKLSNLFTEKLEELQKDEKELLVRFSKKDDDGNPVMIGQNFDIPQDTENEWIEERTALLNETISVDCSELKVHTERLTSVLIDLDMILKDEDAIAYDVLLDQLEKEGDE